MKSILSLFFLVFFVNAVWAEDPLPSWKEGKTKAAIIAFVQDTCKKGSASYIPPTKRIATFDNDGCLWSEQPVYFQFVYAIDRVKELASEHPEWKEKEPFKSVLAGDLKAVLAGGQKSIDALMMTTHAGVTNEEFQASVAKWLKTARHPKTKRLYKEMVFQPMLELLAYLKANDYKTFIVSGGGIDFLRVFAEDAYGIPPERVVGSSIKAKYEVRDGKPVMVKLPELNFIDDGEGKPVGIHQHIGRRPVFAAGNSDGDFQMLEWTTSGKGARFGLIVHHTDEKREWAYDRKSSVGKLSRGLDEAGKRGWHLVDMKNEWLRIYPDVPARP